MNRPAVLKAAPVPIQWHPELCIYSSESFLKSVGDEYGWLGGLDETGHLRCVLPYTVVKKGIFRMVRFRTATIPLGEGADDFSIEDEKTFLDLACDCFRAMGADMIIPATTNTIFRTYPKGAVAAPYGTFIVRLQQDEAILFSKLNSSHRRKVRLATKAGVQICSGMEYLEPVYELVRDTFRRSRMGFMSLPSFGKFVQGLGENVKIFAAKYNGSVQGGMVVPYSQHRAYYVYGGSIVEPQAGAMNLLHWEAVRLFRSMGVGEYDFVGVRIDPEKGSKQEGLMQFKERFGGELVRGYMWKYGFKPLKFFAYNVAARVLRGGDIVDQERHKLLRNHEPMTAMEPGGVEGEVVQTVLPK